MAIKPLPSQEVLRQLLKYEPDTGKLFWLARKPGATDDPRGPQWAANRFNSTCAGKEAFTYSDRRGYRHGKFMGVKYQAHRIIWKMVNGVDPDTIDHINGDPSDNRISNLRNCSNSENGRNYEKLRKGSSRYRGVSWASRDKWWVAQISNGNGGKISLGRFSCEEAAAKAYDQAARERHGDFATLNFSEVRK